MQAADDAFLSETLGVDTAAPVAEDAAPIVEQAPIVSDEDFLAGQAGADELIAQVSNVVPDVPVLSFAEKMARAKAAKKAEREAAAAAAEAVTD